MFYVDYSELDVILCDSQCVYVIHRGFKTHTYPYHIQFISISQGHLCELKTVIGVQLNQE